MKLCMNAVSIYHNNFICFIVTRKLVPLLVSRPAEKMISSKFLTCTTVKSHQIYTERVSVYWNFQIQFYLIYLDLDFNYLELAALKQPYCERCLLSLSQTQFRQDWLIHSWIMKCRDWWLIMSHLGVVFLLNALVCGPLLWLGDPRGFPFCNQPHSCYLEPEQHTSTDMTPDMHSGFMDAAITMFWEVGGKL